MVITIIVVTVVLAVLGLDWVRDRRIRDRLAAGGRSDGWAGENSHRQHQVQINPNGHGGARGAGGLGGGAGGGGNGNG